MSLPNRPIQIRLIELRSLEPPLSVGSYREIVATPELLVFERRQQTRCMIVALNFGAFVQNVSIQQDIRIRLSSTFRSRSGNQVSQLTLHAHEGIIAEICA
jgi:hypothetical protein